MEIIVIKPCVSLCGTNRKVLRLILRRKRLRNKASSKRAVTSFKYSYSHTHNFSYAGKSLYSSAPSVNSTCFVNFHLYRNDIIYAIILVASSNVQPF
ncbi:hypothetical protein B566_EDAN015612 [Ephemera danica]|nr:hypothetical protein B566_EDAN015612 [Ephemera danica]